MQPPTSGQSPARRSGAGMLLWIILLALVLIAVARYFIGRDAPEHAPVDPMTPVGKATVQPSTSPVSVAPPREAAPARQVPADRDAAALEQPAPEYPAAALRAGVEGTTVVRVDVDANGNATGVEVARSSRSRDLDRAALQAVRDWRFEPAVRDGERVASSAEVPVDFRLETQ